MPCMSVPLINQKRIKFVLSGFLSPDKAALTQTWLQGECMFNTVACRKLFLSQSLLNMENGALNSG